MGEFLTAAQYQLGLKISNTYFFLPRYVNFTEARNIFFQLDPAPSTGLATYSGPTLIFCMNPLWIAISVLTLVRTLNICATK